MIERQLRCWPGNERQSREYGGLSITQMVVTGRNSLICGTSDGKIVLVENKEAESTQNSWHIGTRESLGKELGLPSGVNESYYGGDEVNKSLFHVNIEQALNLACIELDLK